MNSILVTAKFSLKDLGRLNYFLGVQVLHLHDGIFLSQRKYITDLLQKAGLHASKPVSTPISATYPLLRDGGTILPSPSEYRQLVDSLQYLSLTRSDIAFTVNKLSQFMQTPCADHWTALKRLLRSSRKHKSVARSSTEVEYKALAETAFELL
ncbi:hypothetical protein V2J09_009903 [Rumex salicifolius]